MAVEGDEIQSGLSQTVGHSTAVWSILRLKAKVLLGAAKTAHLHTIADLIPGFYSYVLIITLKTWELSRLPK